MTRPHLLLSILLGLFALCVPCPAPDAPRPTGFRDDFSNYAEGSSGAPRWNVLAGDWKVRGGKLVQLADGESFAIAAEAGAGRSYRLEARFRTVAGISGEGILFGLRDARRVGACHLVRVDPEGLYYGSIDSSGEFRGDGPVPALVVGRQWNTLAVTVRAAAGTYALEFNGKLVAEGLPLEHSGRAVGLVSNWGEQEFALCAAVPMEEETPTAAEAAAERPVDIATTAQGRILVLDRKAPVVRVLAEDSSRLASFGRMLDQDRPIAIESGPSGEVYVLDEETGRIDRYPAEGGPESADPAKIPPTAEPRAIAATPSLAGPRGLAVLPDGKLVVAESAAGRVAILSPSGARLGEVGQRGEGPGRHQRPSDVAVDSRGRVLVADFRDCRVQAFKPDGKGGYALDARSPWMAPPGRLAVCPGDRLAVLGRFAYYETGGAVRLLEPDLMPRGFVGCFAAGNMSEEGGVGVIPSSSSAGLLCLSRRDALLYRLPLDLSGAMDVRPGVSYSGSKTLIEWRPLLAAPPAQGRLEYRQEGEPLWREAPVTRQGDRLLATIEGMSPEMPHEYRFRPVYDAGPLVKDAERAWSKIYRAYGPEPSGKKRYLEISIICALYLGFEDQERTFTMEREKLGDKLEREFQVGRLFYARNTRLRLHTRLDFEVIEGTRAKVKNGWLDPSQARQDLEPLLAGKGKKVDDYDSIVAMWAEPGWRADAPDDPGTVGGGGLTSFAYSAFGIGGRAAWLFVHEYHHQIDAFFNHSGYLDYPLNHPDPTVEPGRYGQHWDCNAFYLRGWPEQDWFLSRYGKVRWTADSDGDGLPDNDPALPFDEARLGTDPTRKDTDGDGLNDLDEATAGTFRGTDPRNPDTDGDGARDGEDKLPLNRAFSGIALLAKGPPRIDGRIEAGEWQEVGSIRNPEIVVSASWDAEHLYFAARAPRPVRVSFELDGANNGWFLEDDNAFAEVELNGSDAPPIHGAPGARAAGSGGAAVPCAEIALPASSVAALKLAPGSRFGLCVRVSWVEGARDRELFLFDPWELLEITLLEWRGPH